ncbi:MAG: hypothetical protein JRF22_07475 [Deltaproteobacteria bacterium]|nr:hypothetical protein [Deltaproteobacteria bacterium]
MAGVNVGNGAKVAAGVGGTGVGVGALYGVIVGAGVSVCVDVGGIVAV